MSWLFLFLVLKTVTSYTFAFHFSGFIVTQTTVQVPDFDFWQAFSDVDAAAIEHFYHDFRAGAIQSVVSAGGSSADGAVFFRVAVIHLSRLAYLGNVPHDISFPDYINQLATLHFKDWLAERNPGSSGTDAESATPEHGDALPEMESLRLLRRSVWARRQFFRLPKEDQYRIQHLADDVAQPPQDRRFLTEEDALNEGFGTSINHYKNLLKEQAEHWSDVLPIWVVTALYDEHFVRIWDKTQQKEQELAGISEKQPHASHFWRNTFLVLVLGTLVLALYFQLKPSQTPGEVYKENFSAPESIMADLEARQLQSPDKDSLGARPEACDEAFQEADAAYQDENYQMAAAALAQILDETHKPCNSDAYFYLAIVGLQMKEPDLTIECLSNIDDLARYGEDIYWYQALAFVQMATHNPLMAEKASSAVQRVISNTEIPERRAQAQKMLEQLND